MALLAPICADTLLTLKPYYGILPMNHPDALAPYPCLQCRRRCYTIQDLDLHARWHRRENECSLCHKTFASFDIFTGHVRKHYVDATKDYSVNNQIRDVPETCRFCHENFTNVRDLHRHLQLYGENYLECDECQDFLPACHKHFKRTGEANLELHQAVLKGTQPIDGMVQDSVDKPLKICKDIKKFSYQIRAEPNLRPYHCDICSIRFGDRQSLISHLNQHYTEHHLLYDESHVTFPSTTRLKLRENNMDSHSYGLSF